MTTHQLIAMAFPVAALVTFGVAGLLAKWIWVDRAEVRARGFTPSPADAVGAQYRAARKSALAAIAAAEQRLHQVQEDLEQDLRSSK